MSFEPEVETIPYSIYVVPLFASLQSSFSHICDVSHLAAFWISIFIYK